MEAAVPKFEVWGAMPVCLPRPYGIIRLSLLDVVVVFGNSAQVMRSVQAALYHQGRYLTSSFGGRLWTAQSHHRRDHVDG